MKIILLTHEREVTRPSNTGQLALAAFPHRVQRIIWSRTQADPHLLAALASRKAKLLFPRDKTKTQHIPKDENAADDLQHEIVVIVDATWQEASKMFRQSPYLKAAACIALDTPAPSDFALRRNQVDNGLCTVECIITLWQRAGLGLEAAALKAQFLPFNTRQSS